MKYFALLFCFLLANIGMAQESTNKDKCACCLPEYQQFDFWIGDWKVFDTDGNEIGKNLIVAMQDHCILQENWTSKNSTGSSYNYYNRQDKSWNQVWVDNFGNPLVLKGGMENESMVMRSAVTTDKEGNEITSQVTWTLQADGSVLQLWEAIGVEDGSRKILFKGIYRRME